MGEISYTHFIKDDTYGVHGAHAEVVLKWNLRKDLNDQSPETIEFIGNVLGV